MTKQDRFDVTIVLDRSGSMQAIRSDMEGAIAKLIDDQAAQPGECRLSLYQFDDQFEQVLAAVDVKTRPTVKLEPRGNTALHDAVARAIDATGRRLAELPEDQRPAKVIFTVVTDGMENSSREHTKESVRLRVERQTRDYGWQFLFLGAGLDSHQQGTQYGMQAVNYVASPVGAQCAMDSYSAALTTARSSGKNMQLADDLTPGAQ